MIISETHNTQEWGVFTLALWAKAEEEEENSSAIADKHCTADSTVL